MADRLMIAVLCLTTGLSASVQAQLTDPTRPLQGTVAAETAGDGAAATTGLQSIILRKGGRPAALINGEVVELGGMVGEAKLVNVSEDSVVLLGPEGRETLRLIPSAEKKSKVDAGGTAKSIGMNAVKGESRK